MKNEQYIVGQPVGHQRNKWETKMFPNQINTKTNLSEPLKPRKGSTRNVYSYGQKNPKILIMKLVRVK
jgi:hypothetical protein